VRQNITADVKYPTARIPKTPGPGFMGSPAKIIIDADLLDILLEELHQHMRADQPGITGDQDAFTVDV
jgi:hypothetical protein